MSQLFVDTIRNRDGNGAPVFDKGVVISGIITASGSLAGDSVSIGVTEVVSSGFELKNIIDLDATTTATIEAAIVLAPNDFASLNVSGISTFGSNIDLNGNIDILGHTETNTLNATGILTAALLSTGTEGSDIRISSNTISGPATITIDPAGIGTNTGTVVINGDLQVDGDTTTVNSTTLTVDDKNIILASGSLTDASSDGGGITLESGEGNKTINWVDSTDSWTFSENIDLAASKTFKINGTDVLSSTTVGSAVTNSSLQNVGTLAGVQVSGAATIGGDLDVDGHTNLDNVNVSGAITATTFTGNLAGSINTAEQTSITKLGTLTELDVTGQTDLRNVSIVGVTTFTGNIDANADLDVDGHTNLDNVSIAGVVTATTFIGNGDFVELDVDGHTNLDNVSIAGVTTTSGLLDINAGGQANTFKVEDLTDNRVIIAGTGGELEDDANLTFNGSTLAVGVNLDITGDLDVDGHTNLDNVTVGGAITATTFTGSLSGEVDTAAQPNITSVGTLTGLTISGNITAQADLDVDGHTNLDNVSIAGVVTATTFIGNGDFVELDVDGHTNLDNVSIAGVTTFAGNIDADADLDVDGHTNLDNVSIAGVTTFASRVELDGDLDVDGTTELDVLNVAETATFSANIDANKSVDVAGNLNTLTLRAGLSTFTGFVYDELDPDTSLRNAGDFNNITGVAFTSGSTDTLYWDFATAPSVIGGEASNGIENIELAGLPTNSKYMVRATLITFTDAANDWDTGNVVLKVNGQTPTNYLWRNGAQPVGTTTGSSNAFDIVEFKIVHDTNDEFSVFAEWSAYHAST